MSESFVPVTVDQKKLLKERDRYTAEIEAIRKLTSGKAGYLGVYAASSSGELLGSVYEMPNEGKAEHMLTMLRGAFAKVGPVSPRSPQAASVYPDRGLGVRPDGSVRLALSVRYMDDGKPQPSPVFASLFLSAAEWAVLIPREAKPGERYQAPESVARLFAEAISGMSNLEYLIRAEDATSAALAAEVLPATPDGAIQVRLAGHVEGKRDYLKDPKQPIGGRTSIEGILTLDAQRRPQRLLMLFEGDYSTPPPWGKQRPVAAVADWREGTAKP